MIDVLQLCIVMSLCDKYKYRFNSSKKQIDNGTISLIANGKLWEISSSYQVRERVCSRQPCPCYPTQVIVKKKLSDRNSYVEALVGLHDVIGDGDLDTNAKPTYSILYRDVDCTGFSKIGYTEKDNFKDIKKKFKELCQAFGIYKRQFFYFQNEKNNACVMLIEHYNGNKRLLDIKNTILTLNKKEVDEVVERS